MAIEKVVNVKVVDNVQATTQNVANLKTQLREAVGEVQKLSDEFGATSKQAIDAAKRAADLKDRIEDANDAIQAFKGEGAFLATAKSLGAVSGGFTALQGAMSLAGSESENVEKAILKVQSAMAITQGLESIEDAGRSFKQLGAVIRSTTIFQKALSAATAVQTFVTNGATLAAKLLRGALISTGIGALVVGVGLLIANFDKVKKVVMTLIPGLSAVGDVVMSIVNTVTDFIGVTSEAGRSIDKMVLDSQKTLTKNQEF
jgi:phage-related protein